MISRTNPGTCLLNELSPEQHAALERLADKLEADLMPCPLPRAELLTFLRRQVEGLQRSPPLTTANAAWMIDNAYIQWVAQALHQ